MEKRALIAIALSFLILVIWSKFFAPPKPVTQPAPVTITGETPALEMEPAVVDERPRVEDETPRTAEEEAAQIVAEHEETLVIETAPFTVHLTNRGGVATSWRLHQYTANGGEPLELFPRFVEQSQFPLAFALDDRALAEFLNDSLFQVERERLPRHEELGKGERVSARQNHSRSGAMVGSSTLKSRSSTAAGSCRRDSHSARASARRKCAREEAPTTSRARGFGICRAT
jgi:YidC/Oxa1 family membrane protein insertase